MTIDAAPAVLAAFARAVPDGVPVVMVNLLRYRAQTNVAGSEVSGRQAYERYATAVAPIIMAVGGRPLWSGRARFVLIGPAQERWDEVILVAYPRRSAFERMLRSPEYRAAAGLRTAALEDSRLIAVTTPRRISRVGWSLAKLSASFRRRARPGPADG